MPHHHRGGGCGHAHVHFSSSSSSLSGSGEGSGWADGPSRKAHYAPSLLVRCPLDPSTTVALSYCLLKPSLQSPYVSLTIHIILLYSQIVHLERGVHLASEVFSSSSISLSGRRARGPSLLHF